MASISLIALGAQETFAQSRQIPAPPQTQPILIHGATIHPVSSDIIENGFVLFENGKISAIGAGGPPDVANMIELDGAGLHVYPGLIASSTYVGLSEIGDISQTNDYTELGRVKPEVRAAVAINPDSDLIPVARANGILTAMIFPRGGLISGRCSAVRLDGWTWESMAIDAEAGLVINWPRTEPIASPFMRQSEEEQRKSIKEDLEAIEQVFDDANAYFAARDNDGAGGKMKTDLRFEAMRPMVDGTKPIFVNANSSGQIESAIAWANRRNLRIVIVGGNQADQALTLLKKHDVPVILGGTHRMPQRRHDAYDQPFALAAKLHAAGVRFCIASNEEAAHERNLNHMAATAAAYGLPKDEALKAVTLSAAQILGLSDYGSLEPGKSATLIITTGDPLEITTDVLTAFLDGRRLDLGSRHKALHEKYREKYRQLENAETPKR